MSDTNVSIIIVVVVFVITIIFNVIISMPTSTKPVGINIESKESVNG